jgi:hypothetical protein
MSSTIVWVDWGVYVEAETGYRVSQLPPGRGREKLPRQRRRSERAAMTPVAVAFIRTQAPGRRGTDLHESSVCVEPPALAGDGRRIKDKEGSWQTTQN